jgi:AraC-like DNA-binding protein
MISAQQCAPHPALALFVKAYAFLHSQHRSPQLMLPLAPVPETCLYFYPKSPLQIQSLTGQLYTTPDNVLLGQATARTNLLMPADYLMFKVWLQPAGFFRLFGIPMTLFTNSHEEIQSVLGNQIKPVREQIEQAQTFQQMVAIMDAFLLKKIGTYKVQRHPIDAVIAGMHSPNTRFSLDELAHQACLSTRQFERKFLERTGVSPKFYNRLVRFNQAMNLKKKQASLSWLAIAYQCGYFDHNHLLRDFKEFMGQNPSEFSFGEAIIY